MKNYVKYLIIGSIAILAVTAAVLVLRKKEDKKPEVAQKQDVGTQNTQTVSTTNQTNTTSVRTVPVSKPVVPKPVISKAAPQSYTDAAEKYKNSGYYIQFYPCQATPGSLIVKQGSKIMLDNRDSKAHSIGIKNDKYLIASYSYAIATLNVIGTNYVTCDGGGSATITVVP